MAKKKCLEIISERRRNRILKETPEQRQQRLDKLDNYRRASRLRRRINQLKPEQNLVETLPEPGIEPRTSVSMENMDCHEEPETGQRPSRKAALVAAKKISNSIRNYVVKDGLQDLPASTTTSPKPKKTTPVSVDLQMECCDDLLSPIQAEFLIKAQTQYNMVMKNLRELMACNVKVIQTDPFGLTAAEAPAPNMALKTINVPSNVKLSRIKPITFGLVVPVTLSSASSQSSSQL